MSLQKKSDITPRHLQWSKRFDGALFNEYLIAEKISAGAFVHSVNIIIYGKLQTSVIIEINKRIHIYCQYFDFYIIMNCHMNREL